MAACLTAEDFGQRCVTQVSIPVRRDTHRSHRCHPWDRARDRQVEVDAGPDNTVPANICHAPRIECAREHLLRLHRRQAKVDSEIGRDSLRLLQPVLDGLRHAARVRRELAQLLGRDTIEVIDEDRVHSRQRARANGPGQITGIPIHQEKADVDTRLPAPASSSRQVLDRIEDIIGARVAPKAAIPLAAARERHREHIHRTAHDPLDGIPNKIAVGRQSDPAAGGMRVPRHVRDPGMEQRLTPSLQVEVFDERQIVADPVPVCLAEISLEPVVAEGRTRAHRTLPGTATRYLDLQCAQFASCHRLRINHRPSAGIAQRLPASSVMAVPPTWV